MRVLRPRRGSDDTGSLPLAMLLVIVGTGLAAVLSSLVVNELTVTRTDMRRLQALNAAHTGLEVGLARIRTALDHDGAGDPAKLPCAVSAAVAAEDLPGRYDLRVSYLTTDPRDRSADWIDQHQLPCTQGPSAVPRFAVLRSTGWDRPGGVSRLLHATYTFSSRITGNHPGGPVRQFLTAMCLDPGTADPPPHTVVALSPCDDDAERKRFVYNAALNVVHVSPSSAQALCLDAPSTVGALVRLEPCRVPAVPSQQWSYNDARNFEGTSDGRTLNGYCFNAVNGVLRMARATMVNGYATGDSPCRRPAYDSVQSFAPAQTVGAGGAGPGTGQLVNYEEFGRCLDADSFSMTLPPLVYPCKQAPDPNEVGWNQRWTTPAPGRAGLLHLTDPDGTRYCLAPPPDGAGDPRLSFEPCPVGPPPARLTWLVRGRTDRLESSYRIEDHLGRCLASAPDRVRHAHLANWAVVTTCDGGKTQKWNAEPRTMAAALTNLAER